MQPLRALDFDPKAPPKARGPCPLWSFLDAVDVTPALVMRLSGVARSQVSHWRGGYRALAGHLEFFLTLTGCVALSSLEQFWSQPEPEIRRQALLDGYVLAPDWRATIKAMFDEAYRLQAEQWGITAKLPPGAKQEGSKALIEKGLFQDQEELEAFIAHIENGIEERGSRRAPKKQKGALRKERLS